MDTEEWRELHEMQREKRRSNLASSLDLLKLNGIKVELLSQLNGHYRIGEYDFWPTTGKFIHRKTQKHGRGVRNLIKRIKET